MRGYRPVTLEVTAAVSSTQVPAIGAASGRGPHDGCPIQAREVRELLATIGRPTPAPTPPRDHACGPATLRTDAPPSRGGLAYTPPTTTWGDR